MVRVWYDLYTNVTWPIHTRNMQITARDIAKAAHRRDMLKGLIPAKLRKAASSAKEPTSSSSSEHTTPAHTAASSLHLVFFQGSASRLSFIFLRDYVTFLTKKSVLGYADPSRKVTRLWILKQSTGQGKDHGRAGQLAFISKGTHKSNGHLLKMYALQKKKAISNFALKNGLDDWNSDDFDDAKTFKY